MTNTPRKHFDEDFKRAMAILSLAETLEDSLAGTAEATGLDAIRLYNDMRISAIAMTAGAMDAYFCDAYVDCLSSVLSAYARGQWEGELPSAYARQLLPAGELLDYTRNNRPGWNIKMASRRIMEKDDMLDIGRLDEHFNGILPASQKLWIGLLPSLMLNGRKRLTGPLTDEEISALKGKKREKATKKAVHTFKTRIGKIVQIRHDWIHNCGRPKEAIATYTHGEARARMIDVADFVRDFDDHIHEYRLV